MCSVSTPVPAAAHFPHKAALTSLSEGFYRKAAKENHSFMIAGGCSLS